MVDHHFVWPLPEVPVRDGEQLADMGQRSRNLPLEKFRVPGADPFRRLTGDAHNSSLGARHQAPLATFFVCANYENMK